MELKKRIISNFKAEIVKLKIEKQETLELSGNAFIDGQIVGLETALKIVKKQFKLEPRK